MTKATGVVSNGKKVEVPDLPVINFLDEPKYGLNQKEDMRPRGTSWIRSVVLHTTKGMWPQKVLPGFGPDTKLEQRITKLWSTDARNAGAHLSVDWDGTVCCHADLFKSATYHATTANEVSIGIEVYQGPDGELYESQLATTVRLVNFLTALFGIQRQMPSLDQHKKLERLANGAKDFVGVFGHRHVTDSRGRGDPGDAVFEKLAEAGYEQYMLDIQEDEDVVVWKGRQEDLGLPADGIPGPKTAAALLSQGKPDGLWVTV